MKSMEHVTSSASASLSPSHDGHAHAESDDQCHGNENAAVSLGSTSANKDKNPSSKSASKKASTSRSNALYGFGGNMVRAKDEFLKKINGSGEAAVAPGLIADVEVRPSVYYIHVLIPLLMSWTKKNQQVFRNAYQ
jgi:hypothetical protein